MRVWGMRRGSEVMSEGAARGCLVVVVSIIHQGAAASLPTSTHLSSLGVYFSLREEEQSPRRP